MSLGFLVGLVFTSTSFATTVLIVTDQPKAVKAQEIAGLFRVTEPFSLMKDLKLKVIQTSSSKLGCQVSAVSKQAAIVTEKDMDSANLLSRIEWHAKSSLKVKALALPRSCENDVPAVARLISCDSPQSIKYLKALAKAEKAKYVIIAKNELRYGGSGGTYPVVTTGSPATMAIHELMHQLGFADEYAYNNACEADLYCSKGVDDVTSPSGYGYLPGTSFNIAAFNARANYSSNAQVRTIHGKEIPWLSFIKTTTDLTVNGKLGSDIHLIAVGLFRSIVCDKASAETDTWQPTTNSTIMKTLSTTYIPKSYWPTLAKSLGTKIVN